MYNVGSYQENTISLSKKGILKLYTFDGRKVYYKKSEISENLKVREKNDNQNSSIYIHVVFMIIVITLI